MDNNDHPDIRRVLATMRKEIQKEVKAASKALDQAFETQDYERIHEVSGKVVQLETMANQASGLQANWNSLFGGEVVNGPKRMKPVKSGPLTPKKAYFKPILKALVSLGGAGKPADVIDLVYQKMEAVLTDADRNSTEGGNPDYPRWKTASYSTRSLLIKQELLKANSPKGVWEISVKGRNYVASFGNYIPE